MELNRAVFTTKQIINENQPILLVVCDEDGEMQFLGGENVEMSDIMIVSLQNIIDHDNSIRSLIHLQRNMEAKRNSPEDEWSISRIT